VLLLPGGVLADLVVRTKEFSPPPLVLGANALVYSVMSYIGVSIVGRGAPAEKMRLTTIRLALPVAILVVLACIPKFNPLWPRGMTELTSQENLLQEDLPIGLEDARAALSSKGIQFQEETEMSRTLLLERHDKNIVASAGDRVISARIETEASQYPCAYDIQVILVFGPNERLEERYIRRLRLCP
jgi:hypothetical protein